MVKQVSTGLMPKNLHEKQKEIYGIYSIAAQTL